MNKYNCCFIHSIMILALSLLFCISSNADECKLYDFNNSLAGDPTWTSSYDLHDMNSELQVSNWSRVSDDFKVAPWSISTGKLKLQGYYNITKRVTGPGNVTFWWKKTKLFDKIGTLLYVVIDDSVKAIYTDQSFDWVSQPSLDFGPGTHNITWVFRIKVLMPSHESQGWIDEVQICESNTNRSPSLTNLVPDKRSPQDAGETIAWTAIASDPENDSLQYKFFLRGPAANGRLIEETDWTSDRVWRWRTTLADLGDNEVEVWVRDDRHRGPEGFDDEKNADFTIIEPRAVPSVIEVSTIHDLEREINNDNSIMKIIHMRCSRYTGSIHIYNRHNITIEPDPNCRGYVIFDGGNCNYIFAVEDSSNISIKGFWMLNGNNSIILEDSLNCSIIGNTIKSFDIDGISLNNTSNTTIKDNIIESLDSTLNVSGINLTSSRNDTINNNMINVNHGDNIYDSAILLNNSSNNSILFKGTGSIVENNLQCGVKCLNNMPVYSDDTDPNSHCSDMIERKINHPWSFEC